MCNNITRGTNRNYRTVATLYRRDMVWFSCIIVNTLRKGDNKRYCYYYYYYYYYY